jgi:hypothetical protein
MFSAQMQYPGVDPWVAAWHQSAENQHQVSRAAAARHAVVQAVRERRTASRSARHTPVPVRVEPVNSLTAIG